MKNRKLLLTVIAVLLILSLAACSSKADSSAQASAGGAAEEAAPDVQTVVVAVNAGMNPLSYLNEETDEPDGYAVDILKAIDELVPEYEIKVEVVDEEAGTVGLDAGAYAAYGGGLFRTAEREEKYLFTENNVGLTNELLWIHKDNTDIQSMDDLVGKTISPPSPGGGVYNLLVAYNEEHPDNQLDFAPADGPSVADRVIEISEKKYDALILPDNLGIADIIEELNLDVKWLETPVQSNRTYFVFSKSSEDFRDKADEALTQLFADGTMSEICLKWYGVDKFANQQ